MPCYHPLKAFNIGTTAKGKADLKVVPYSVDHLELVELDGKLKIIRDFEPVDWSYCPPGHIKYYTDFVEIPCGKCIGCRLDYSRQWANRLMLENFYHTSSYFITLTYNDNSLNKICKNEYKVDDKVFFSYSLRKRDFQLFMKRLREKFSDQHIRFYACGEYGGHSKRPHYHAIIFGLQLDDLVLLKHNFDGDPYYVSESLSLLWPHGFHLVTRVTWNTCAYVARYVVKKYTGDMAELYEKFNIEPEFCTMSLKPGIARAFYDEHKHEIYSGDGRIRVPVPDDPLCFSPPKYFDRLYEDEDASFMADLKYRRSNIGRASRSIELSNTDLPDEAYFVLKEQDAINRASRLKRGECNG